MQQTFLRAAALAPPSLETKEWFHKQVFAVRPLPGRGDLSRGRFPAMAEWMGFLLPDLKLRPRQLSARVLKPCYPVPAFQGLGSWLFQWVCARASPASFWHSPFTSKLVTVSFHYLDDWRGPQPSSRTHVSLCETLNRHLLRAYFARHCTSSVLPGPTRFWQKSRRDITRREQQKSTGNWKQYILTAE